MKNLQIFFIYIFVAMITLLGCEQKQPPSKGYLIDLLARDAYFSINGRVLQLPLVAASYFGPCDTSDKPFQACSISREKLIKQYGPKYPLPVSGIGIDFISYDTYMHAPTDEYVDISELCQKLSRRWAQKVCKDRSAEKLFGLDLDRFWLIQTDKVKFYPGSIGGGVDSLESAVKKMKLNDKIPDKFCGLDKEGKPLTLCYVAVQLSDDLLAVWIQEYTQTNSDYLGQQVRVINSFIEYSIGEKEDLAAFHEAIK